MSAVYQDHHPHYDIPPLVETATIWIILVFVPLSIEFPMTAFFGTTFGKCVFGIKVVGRSTDSMFKARMLFRTLVKWFYFIVCIYLPLALDSDQLFRTHEYPIYPSWIYGEWTPIIRSIVQTDVYGPAALIFNIVMLVLILGLHRKDRLGIFDQIVGTRLVRASDC